ncbi:MAG: metallophosphoesterase [Pseudomonadota bacterium]
MAPGTRVYAVGDVHGRLDLLIALESRIAEDAAGIRGCERRILVMLGDYVDRGRWSRGVLDHLCDPPPAGFERVLLCGNHDWWMQQFLDEEGDPLPWLTAGGDMTLESYGVDVIGSLAEPGAIGRLRQRFARRVPPAHRRLLNKLVFMHNEGDYLFVHAGIRPGLPLEHQERRDLMFIREPFLSEPGDLGVVVVHGHTIVREPVVTSNRIGIDTGAWRTERLTAAVFEDRSFRFLSTEA